ncbi:MAG TPA: hypothetical protein VGV87_09690 [Blastocatellia bacterium]|nr:hypothetical protein [Blastocatellia bacterium]
MVRKLPCPKEGLFKGANADGIVEFGAIGSTSCTRGGEDMFPHRRLLKDADLKELLATPGRIHTAKSMKQRLPDWQSAAGMCFI